MNHITTIECSLRCFTCGLLGLIPIVGAGFSVASLMNFVRACGHGDDWNPARHYAFLGLFFAIVGLLVSLASWGFLAFYCRKQFWEQ